MLCLMTWEFTDTSDAAEKKLLEVFSRWEPPKGYDIQGFWGYADGTGGASVVDVDSAEAIAKALAPYTPYARFSVRPILPIQDAVALTTDGIAFRNA
jgi:hypothetical protein